MVLKYEGRRDIRATRKRRDILAEQWVRRSIINFGGSLAVILPKKMIEFSRQAEVDPFRWSAGDTVKIGMTSPPNARIVIVYEGQERGFVSDQEAEDLVLHEPQQKQQKQQKQKGRKRGSKSK